MSHHDLVLFGRVAVAFVLSFGIGFEREVRGAPAGDRTYALVGLGAAAVTAVTIANSPQAVAGVVTGIGFIGAGLMFRVERGVLRGMTSAATIWVVAAIGVVSGSGHLVLAFIVASLVVVDLELRQIPALRRLDARRYTGKVADDMRPPIAGPPNSAQDG